MVSLSLSDGQEALRRAAHAYARDIVRPAAADHDARGCFPRRELETAWSAGLKHAAIPTAQGGRGCDLMSQCVIVEEVAWGCAGFAAGWVADELATSALAMFGTDAQKAAYLRPLTERFGVGAFAASEPGAGSDLGGVRTVAAKRDDRYVLTGAKRWITNGGDAAFYVVLATVDRAAKDRGLTAFVVPRGTAGVTVGPAEDTLGLRCADMRPVQLDDCAIPEDHRIGADGQGAAIFKAIVRRSRTLVAAAATGLARAAMEAAVRHAVERQSMGAPLAAHQAIQLMLADMARDVHMSRLLTWSAACALDRDGGAGDGDGQAAIAKFAAADAAMRVTTGAVEVLGASGLSRERQVEKWMRDAKALQIADGTGHILRFVAATELITATIRGL